MKLLLSLIGMLLLGSTISAQTFNPVNRFLVSGNAYAFTELADTGRDLDRIRLQTAMVFQQRLAAWQKNQPVGASAKNFAGLDTLFRNSAFAACKDVITHSGMTYSSFRNDSVVALVRKDQFHAAVATYDSVRERLSVYFWCQGYTWKQTLNVPIENLKKTADPLDRYSYYVLMPDWALLQGRLCPTRFSDDLDFAADSAAFTVPEKELTPIRFSLRSVLPDAGWPDIRFDYHTEAKAYLAGIESKTPVTTPVVQKRLVLRSAEKMPEFNGNFTDYISDNVVYPSTARAAGMEGLLIVRFIVSETGAIEDLKIERGTGSELLDAEGLRVFKAMPAWKPGYQRDEKGTLQAVKVYYRAPLLFRLD